MNNPTMQELMEYLDGTLQPNRFREVEIMISNSSSLQKEITLLKALQRSVRNDIIILPSKKFTSAVLKNILPAGQESLWYRLVKNSSNMFAMILVLAMICIALLSASYPSAGSSNPLSKNIESFSIIYNSTVQTISSWSNQYTHPANEAAKTISGKFLLIGLFAFFVFMIVDDFVGNRYFRHHIKN